MSGSEAKWQFVALYSSCFTKIGDNN